MLTVHHLVRSQSERIVWLCEELGIVYELKRYQRMANNLGPPEYKALSPMGTAPVITETGRDGGDLVLGESGACVDYIIHTHGGGRLALQPGHPDYAQYLHWFHFANGTLQLGAMRMMVMQRLEAPADHPTVVVGTRRFALILSIIDARLKDAPWLAGDAFTAADIMSVFSLTTMRLFSPYDLTPYPNILSYLQRVGARPAYQRAMQKGDPEIEPLLA